MTAAVVCFQQQFTGCFVFSIESDPISSRQGLVSLVPHRKLLTVPRPGCTHSPLTLVLPLSRTFGGLHPGFPQTFRGTVRLQTELHTCSLRWTISWAPTFQLNDLPRSSSLSPLPMTLVFQLLLPKISVVGGLTNDAVPWALGDVSGQLRTRVVEVTAADVSASPPGRLSWKRFTFMWNAAACWSNTAGGAKLHMMVAVRKTRQPRLPRRQ